MMVPHHFTDAKKRHRIRMFQLPKKKRVLCGWPITMLAMKTCCWYRVIYMGKNKITIWFNKIPKLENCGQLMSFHKLFITFVAGDEIEFCQISIWDIKERFPCIWYIFSVVAQRVIKCLLNLKRCLRTILQTFVALSDDISQTIERNEITQNTHLR